MSDQENRDQLQCSVRNERQQQQRGDTVMHRTQGRQGREDRRSCSRNAKCSGVSRQVTRLGPRSHHSSPQYTDLGSQLHTFPELITCVTLPLCNIPSRVLSRFPQPQSQSREETAARSPAGSPETFSLCYPDTALLSPLHSWLLSSSMRTLSSHDAVMNLTDPSQIKLTIEQ